MYEMRFLNEANESRSNESKHAELRDELYNSIQRIQSALAAQEARTADAEAKADAQEARAASEERRRFATRRLYGTIVRLLGRRLSSVRKVAKIENAIVEGIN